MHEELLQQLNSLLATLGAQEADTEALINKAKKLAGEKAVNDHVFAASQHGKGMVVGLGTGSTAFFAIQRVGELWRNGYLPNIRCIPTSKGTYDIASALGIPLITLDDLGPGEVVDVTIDGADAVDRKLNLIKGGGGALLREKMVEMASRKFICIVDEGKMCSQLGPSFALPVEIVQFCHQHTIKQILKISQLRGCTAVLRTGKVSNNKIENEHDLPAITDNGNYIVDIHFPKTKSINHPSILAAALKSIVGVVEHGLFCRMVHQLIVATNKGETYVHGTATPSEYTPPFRP